MSALVSDTRAIGPPTSISVERPTSSRTASGAGASTSTPGVAAGAAAAAGLRAADAVVATGCTWACTVAPPKTATMKMCVPTTHAGVGREARAGHLLGHHYSWLTTSCARLSPRMISTVIAGSGLGAGAIDGRLATAAAPTQRRTRGRGA